MLGRRVVAIANPLPTDAVNRAGDAFIAADVGGTHVRVGLVRGRADPGQPIGVLAYRQYACAEHPGLAAILEDFIAGLGGVQVVRGVIASAGYALDDGTVITNNLPWRLSLAEIRGRLGFDDFRLVNDFEAVAHAAAQIDASQVLHLAGPATAPAGPVLILGPGTGLGAAVWIPAGRRAVVLATEAGQAALATGTPLEMALLAEMQKTRAHVPTEHALSGPGLLNLHAALRAVRGAAPSPYAHPGQVTAAALSGDDPLARETLEVFCGLLGSVVGDMALLYGVQGGVYLAGGVLPKIREFLPGSDFVQRFLNKGSMREALERIPVKLVEHGQLGVVGAARWYLDQGDRD